MRYRRTPLSVTSGSGCFSVALTKMVFSLSKIFLILLVTNRLELAFAKTFTPCELAQKLDSRFSDLITKRLSDRETVARYYTEIPLLVCIAGYHNFTTSNVYVTEDGTKHLGIFGIVAADHHGDSSLLLDDNIDLDIKTFLERVIYVSGSLFKNDNTYHLYSSLCSFSKVHYVKCHLNRYLFGAFRVPVPRRPELLYETYQKPTEERHSESNIDL